MWGEKWRVSGDEAGMNEQDTCLSVNVFIITLLNFHIRFQRLLTSLNLSIKYLNAWFKVIFMFVPILFLLFSLSLDKTHCELSMNMSCLPLLSPGCCSKLANCKKIIWVISSPDDIFRANQPYEKTVSASLPSKCKLGSGHLCKYHFA